MEKFRPAAYPLITVDPFFSVWSLCDILNGSYTRHWTERPAPIYLDIVADGKHYKICSFDQNRVNNRTENKLPQTDVTVTPLTTSYTFENDFLKVRLSFTTPLLLDRLDIMTRPVSYIEYDIARKDGKTDGVGIVFGISAECCVNDRTKTVAFRKTEFSLACGNTEQKPLSQTGDTVLIDWGYLHLCDPQAYAMRIPHTKIDTDKIYTAYIDQPYLAVERNEAHGVITVAYDETYPIEYFTQPIREYYTKYYASFGEMVAAAVAEYPAVKKMCDAFDKKLIAEALKLGENYKNIVSLAYRQAIAAHKLIEDENGEMILLSKECNSNGCIGTLDVTYPSIPLFLKYNPELVFAMLRPILRFAMSDSWKFPFAPHDVGQYPRANGQVYGMNNPDNQMPVEESGNMLLCVAAACRYAGDTSFFVENRDILKAWADYLVEYGYDPGNQLCTDDFAGHLGHNCNLSLKAILGIAAYGDMSGDAQYTEIARDYANRWETDAKAEKATRLTFDSADGWSLKYNMVWDNILGYNLFSEEIKAAETELYLTKMNRYGVPLDSRKAYTKIDWLMWSTCLSRNEAYFSAVTEAIVRMISETPDRVPMTDWYCTESAVHYFFKNRTVVGGLFINLI